MHFVQALYQNAQIDTYRINSKHYFVTLYSLIQGEKNRGKEIELKFDEEVLQVLSPYLISLRD